MNFFFWCSACIHISLQYCSHIQGASPFTSLHNRVESKAICLIAKPSLTSTLNPLSLLFLLLLLWSLFLKWLLVFHLQWLSHIRHVRCHLPTTIVWNFPMQELIGSVMLGFFYSTSYLQNFLPVSVSSASLNLSSFTRWVYHHFRHQMA